MWREVTISSYYSSRNRCVFLNSNYFTELKKKRSNVNQLSSILQQPLAKMFNYFVKRKLRNVLGLKGFSSVSHSKKSVLPLLVSDSVKTSFKLVSWWGYKVCANGTYLNRPLIPEDGKILWIFPKWDLSRDGFERDGYLEALLTGVALVQRLRIPFVDFSNVFMESCECTSGELASIYLRRMNHKSSTGGKSENSWTHLTKVPQLISVNFNMFGQIWFWLGAIVAIDFGTGKRPRLTVTKWYMPS